MEFIVAASSVVHALDTVNPESRKNFNEKIFSIPGLRLSPYTKNPGQIVQILLSKDLDEKNDIVIWHDVLNNSISKHESNNYRALTVLQSLEILKSIEDKLRALVYCHRFPTPNVYQNLKDLEKSTNNKVFKIVEHFISPRKKKDPEDLTTLKALHQSTEIELKHVNFILRKESELDAK